MKDRETKIGNHKLRGEWVEACFLARAAELGYKVSCPWGDSARYDFVVEYDQRFVRVQVKSTTFKMGEGYQCSVKSCLRPYAENAFDFLAAYVVPKNAWYIIPEGLIRGLGSVRLRPGHDEGKYEKYREAWDRLREGPGAGTVANIQACARDFYGLDSLASLNPAFPFVSTSNSLPPQLLHRNELLFGCG